MSKNLRVAFAHLPNDRARHTYPCPTRDLAARHHEARRTFGKIRPETKAIINNIIDKLQLKLLEGVESVFRGVSDNFDLICVVEELPDERRDALRQRIKHYVDYDP